MSASANFQVDLHGIVDLLSEHIYSSPRVYLRELLQNAVDAITARRLDDPAAPATIALAADPDGHTLTIADTGVGLHTDQVADLLATIGRSSKRDEIGFARTEFLGQFGIGLLSAFMVAESIQVDTRPETGPTTRWLGQADGSYTLTQPGAGQERSEIGTTVTLRARPDARDWLKPAMVLDLARTFGSLLPMEISVNGTSITEEAPWQAAGGPGARRAALTGYAQDTLAFTPFDVIDLALPEVGLAGAAFVLPYAANPLERSAHRVYLKRMLLSERVEGLVPEWAFFVRCLVDAEALRPTASREALVDNHLLEATREAIGDRVRSWLVRLGTSDPQRMARFMKIHHLGLRALAVHDDTMLELVDRWVPFETNVGTMTLAEFRDTHGELLFVTSTDEFRQVAAVASAQGIAVINAGYTYDIDVVQRVGAATNTVVRHFDPTDLATSLEPLDPAAEREAATLLAAAREALRPAGCDVVLRSFDPATLPALYLVDRSAAFTQELRATQEKADGLWSAVLGALDTRQSTQPQLVLNYRSPLVRRLVATHDASVVRFALQGLYGQALLQGQHPIRPSDSALVNRSFLGLLELAVGVPEGE